MDNPVVVAVAALVAVMIGLAVGFLARGLWASQSMRTSQEKAARIVAEARTQQKELILEAKDEKLRLQREAEDEARAKRAELSALERRLLTRDEQLDQRTDMLEQRDRKLLEKEREIERTREELAQARSEQVAVLERISEMTADEAKAQLLEAVRVEAESDAVRLARSIERKARDEAQEKAREVIVTAIQRVAADHTAEHTVSVVHLPSDEMKGRIIGREGRNIRALEQATGVDLIIDDTPETVVLSGFDPVRREIARLALTKLMADGRIHPGRIEEVVDKARRAEVDLVDPPGGADGPGLRRRRTGLPTEILRLLGRLKYRTSYGQNVLNHCVETSRVAAVMAAELGPTSAPARRVRPPPRHRQGDRPRGRGRPRRDRGRRGPAQRHSLSLQGRERDRGPPPGRAAVRLPRGPDRPGRRRRQRRRGRAPAASTVEMLREAPRGPADDRGLVRRGRATHSRPGGPRGAVLVRPEEIVTTSRRPRLARDIVRKTRSRHDLPGEIKVTVIRETRAVEYAK